jgi:hypothetical protein
MLKIGDRVKQKDFETRTFSNIGVVEDTNNTFSLVNWGMGARGRYKNDNLMKEEEYNDVMKDLCSK